jgi:hypothetical protein
VGQASITGGFQDAVPVAMPSLLLMNAAKMVSSWSLFKGALRFKPRFEISMQWINRWEKELFLSGFYFTFLSFCTFKTLISTIIEWL